MHAGEFFYYYSTMGGGKSLELILDEHRSSQRGATTAIIKPKKDKKAGDNVYTRFGQTKRKINLALSEDPQEALRELTELIATCTIKAKPVVIYLDEVQFLSAEHVLVLREIVDESSICIKAYGLLTDFTGSLFESSKKLLEVCDHKSQIIAHCEIENCSKIAVYNARLVDDKVVTEGPTVAIDGIDAEYMALCSMHYTQSVGK